MADSADTKPSLPANFWQGLSLGAKFTIVVSIILVGAMAANTLYFLGTANRFHEQQLHARGEALGRLISLLSPEPILSFDFLRLNDYTREVSSQQDIVYGVIVNPKGEPVSSYVNGADPLLRDLGAAGVQDIKRVLAHLQKHTDLVQLQFPIVHNKTELGRFLVGISRQSLKSEFQRQLAVQLAILAALVLFLSVAIHFVFRSQVLSPISTLIAASDNVGHGRYSLVDVKSGDELGKLTRAFNDMTKNVEKERAALHRQANYDALTGLPNRMMAFERIKLEISRARRARQRLAVYFIDLDNFKNVNDSLGHAVGDELLVAIGSRVRAVIRETDIVARLGGDEFLVLAPNIVSEVKARELADRLLTAVSEPQMLAKRRVVAKCSVGIALYPDNGESMEDLMANADNAMYQSKATRDGSATFFTREMNVRIRERMAMEQDLNVAVELGQLELNFQPLFHTASEQPHGAEVLLRWRHPEHGWISPATFIPLAESTGQIVGIGDWVLQQACRNWSAWRDAGLDPGFLAVNVSRVQFRRRLSARLAELMAVHRIPPHALEMEITEGVLLDDQSQVADELNSLREAGLKLSLDDFGTGYSSLSYLKRFRFDVLKIDRSFVMDLPDKAEDVLLVKAILAMAKGFDIEVVAEGVENRQQLDFLRTQGCDYSQGYLLAKPMNEAAYTAFLQSRRSSLSRLEQAIA
jgi:diguanylate cyclase (GGDEF)-like protein